MVRVRERNLVGESLNKEIEGLGVIQKVLLTLWVLVMAMRQVLGYGLDVLAFVMVGTNQVGNEEIEYERASEVGERVRSRGRSKDQGKNEEAGKKKRVYTVHAGYVLGIYATWSECKAQVYGYFGAKFKSFRSKEEAERWLRELRR